MTHNLFLYMTAVLTLNLCPGPDMLYVISQSLGKGKRFGLAAVLGIGAGCFIHILAVTLGLATLLVESPFAFMVIKYLGAGYLLYIGLSSLLKKQSTLLNHFQSSSATSWWKTVKQGFITNALNPKVALFFLAFLPQFVDPTSSHSIGLQMLMLGLLFNLSASTVNTLVALFFGTIKNWLAHHPAFLTLQEKFTGLLLIGLGLRLAILK